MNITGLTKKELDNLGYWYTFYNGQSLNSNELGYLHFEKMLRTCHPFNEKIKLTKLPLNNDNINMKFKSVDAAGKPVIINFIHGDTESASSLYVVDDKKMDVLLYDFHEYIDYSWDRTEKSKKEYDKLFSYKNIMYPNNLNNVFYTVKSEEALTFSYYADLVDYDEKRNIIATIDFKDNLHDWFTSKCHKLNVFAFDNESILRKIKVTGCKNEKENHNLELLANYYLTLYRFLRQNSMKFESKKSR